jgi:CBS domain-containing protein
MKVTAKDVMNRSVRTVRDDATVEELASFLMEHDISGAPVVDPHGKLVGVITEHDLVEDRNEAGEPARAEGRAPAWKDKLNPEDLATIHIQSEGRLVKDVMTPAVYTVPEDLAIPEIAKTMVAGRVHRLFVTRAGKVVGTIAALDLLKLLYEEPVRVPAELVPTS